MARVGSGFFLIIQMVIILDFAASWNEAWVEKDDDVWLYGLLGVTVTSYVGSFTLIGFMYHWYASNSGCSLNAWLISICVVLCVLLTVISLLPQVKSGSLMPSSIISLYCTYLCYTALTSEPSSYHCNMLEHQAGDLSQSSMAMGMVITLLSVAYAAMSAGSSSQFLSIEDDEEAFQLTSVGGEPEEGMSRGDDVPDVPVAYSYSFFHLIFALASMYMAMLMTGWGDIGHAHEGQEQIDIGWASVWVKIVSLWLTALLYIWTLIAPIVLPDRDFD